MLKSAIKGVIVIISGLVFGAVGLFLGAYIGGNFAQDFTLFGVRGYEAAGQLGFILGAIMGIVGQHPVLAKSVKIINADS